MTKEKKIMVIIAVTASILFTVSSYIEGQKKLAEKLKNYVETTAIVKEVYRSNASRYSSMGYSYTLYVKLLDDSVTSMLAIGLGGNFEVGREINILYNPNLSTDRIYLANKKEEDGLPNNTAGKNYLKQKGLTAHHHQAMKTIQLIPSDLHNNVPHEGGASKLRKNVCSEN